MPWYRCENLAHLLRTLCLAWERRTKVVNKISQNMSQMTQTLLMVMVRMANADKGS